MRLSKTISRLSKVRKSLDAFAPGPKIGGRLAPLDGVKRNPGRLRALHYAPPGLAKSAPLVVVLHGCTQSAAGYDLGSGWSRLADKHGFALLLPEQQRANNPNLCFNWFETGDTRRGGGEAASIAAMVQRMSERYAIDPARVFVTGLSAGGAMATAMMATYPELFAGGAIIAGVPFGCAANVAQAFGCMAGRDQGPSELLGDKVRAASRHRGPWPSVSVWQGSADHTVVPSNADAIVRQWLDVHGLPQQPTLTEEIDGHRRHAWHGPDGSALIEQYLVAGMAHGTPLAAGTGTGRSGEAGAHMLDVGLSSTDRIAAFWGIAPAAATPSRARGEVRAAAERPDLASLHSASGVGKVIEDALRSAGLMR